MILAFSINAMMIFVFCKEILEMLWVGVLEQILEEISRMVVVIYIYIICLGIYILIYWHKGRKIDSFYIEAAMVK